MDSDDMFDLMDAAELRGNPCCCNALVHNPFAEDEDLEPQKR
ncbi:MAG: hypothetical protein ACRC0L_11670 [Angustibacter sp.]